MTKERQKSLSEKAQELINELQQGINAAILAGDNFNEASWGYEKGILMTPNQAKLVIQVLEAANQESQSKAVAFAEWAHRAGWYFSPMDNLWHHPHSNSLTSTELYTSEEFEKYYQTVKNK